VTLGSSVSLAELRRLYHVVRLWFWICYANGKMFKYILVSCTIFSITHLCTWAGCPCIWCWKRQKSWYTRRSMLDLFIIFFLRDDLFIFCFPELLLLYWYNAGIFGLIDTRYFP
jgi:hypothetical protein